MKLILAVVVLATLGGCAVYPAAPPVYGMRAAQAGSYDPYQWHTVGPGTGTSDYASQPIYAPQPVYVTQPYYAYPPVTIGLDFMFGGWYGGHGGRGGYRGHGRR